MKKHAYIVSLSMFMGLALPAIPVNGENIESVDIVQQQKTVTGLVIDANGEPVLGANIIIKSNPTQGTVTDMDGKFTLTNVPTGSVLVVSYIGYLPQEIKVTNNKNDYRIVLQEDTQALE